MTHLASGNRERAECSGRGHLDDAYGVVVVDRQVGRARSVNNDRYSPHERQERQKKEQADQVPET